MSDETQVDAGVYVRAASRMLQVAAEDPELMKAVKAFDWTKIFQLIPAIVPLIIQLFTGGTFNPALIMALIQALAQIFNVTPSQIQQAISEQPVS